MHHYLKLKLTIQFESRWHTGSGEGNILTDRLIQKDARGMPHIPGSTLKGVIRESCEKLSRTLGFPEPSNPHSTDIKFPGSFNALNKAPSPVDRLFGNKFEEGGIFFRSARLTENVHHHFFTQSRVRMNRKLGTGRDQHLFSSEYGLPMSFETSIDAHHQALAILEEDDPPYAYCLLIAAILMVDRLGGDKSTGAGQLPNNITIESMIYNNNAISIENYLKEKASFYLDSSDYQDVRKS
ncbi:RAMP superfamily CRISPR-associated protein [Desulfobacterales bacterium HSG17]|nr:RAMP superfamily CRISPR-associated protein [Desulfobacterales bacterium HSG17]